MVSKYEEYADMAETALKAVIDPVDRKGLINLMASTFPDRAAEIKSIPQPYHIYKRLEKRGSVKIVKDDDGNYLYSQLASPVVAKVANTTQQLTLEDLQEDQIPTEEVVLNLQDRDQIEKITRKILVDFQKGEVNVLESFTQIKTLDAKGVPTADLMVKWRKQVKTVLLKVASFVDFEENFFEDLVRHIYMCRRNGEFPKIRLLGPPGSGKSYAANALAKMLGCNMIVLNPSESREADEYLSYMSIQGGTTVDLAGQMLVALGSATADSPFDNFILQFEEFNRFLALKDFNPVIEDGRFTIDSPVPTTAFLDGSFNPQAHFNRAQKTIQADPQKLILIATQNQDGEPTGRDYSLSVDSRWYNVYLTYPSESSIRTYISSLFTATDEIGRLHKFTSKGVTKFAGIIKDLFTGVVGKATDATKQLVNPPAMRQAGIMLKSILAFHDDPAVSLLKIAQRSYCNFGTLRMITDGPSQNCDQIAIDTVEKAIFDVFINKLLTNSTDREDLNKSVDLIDPELMEII